MSKDKNLVPKLRFPEFAENIGWGRENLGEIASFFNGRAYKQEELLANGKYRVLRVGNFFTNNEWYYSDLELDENKYCENGDLLYAWSASFGPHLWNGEKIIFHYHIWKIKNKKGIDKLFLYNLLDYETSRIKAQSLNGFALMHVTKGAIESWKIAVPESEKEQQKISSCLFSLDDIITAHSQKLELLKDHKKGLMQNLFPQENERIPKFRFPEFCNDKEWEEKTLGQLLEFKNGINAEKEQYGTGIKFINVLDILQNDFITYDKIIGSVDVDEETIAKFSVNYGDVLFQRSSETQEEAGSANVYLDSKQIATFGGFVIRGRKVGEYDPMFLNKLLKSRSVRDRIISKSAGSTRFNIGQEILSSIVIFLPMLNEQQKIASCLSSLDDLITAQTEKIEQLKAHKKGLMQGLFPKLTDEA